MRLVCVTLLAALALAGCGGEAKQDTAAGLVSGAAAAFVEVDSDLDSEQWQQLDELLRKFPGRADLLREIRDGLEEENLSWEQDVDPALGETTALVWVDFENDGENVVALTQPDDAEKLRQLVAKLDEEEGDDEESVIREVEGWTLVADNDALIDRFAADEESLEEQERYTEALNDLPEERLATAYVDGQRLAEIVRREVAEAEQGFGAFGLGDLDKIESIAAAVAAEGDGLNLTFAARATEASEELGFGSAYDSRFVDEVPGDALAFISFNGETYRNQLERLGQEERDALQQLEQMLGIDVDALFELLGGEGAFYVRPGTPIPEVTLLLETEDEQKALATMGRLARRVAVPFGGGAPPKVQQIEGVTVVTVALGPASINYGAFDDKLVVSLSTGAFKALRSDDQKLADDEDFGAALEAADVPDETSGFLYLDVEDALPTLESLLGFAGEQAEDVPPEVVENLRPLRALVAYGAEDDREFRYVIFAQIE